MRSHTSVGTTPTILVIVVTIGDGPRCLDGSRVACRARPARAATTGVVGIDATAAIPLGENAAGVPARFARRPRECRRRRAPWREWPVTAGSDAAVTAGSDAAAIGGDVVAVDGAVVIAGVFVAGVAVTGMGVWAPASGTETAAGPEAAPDATDRRGALICGEFAFLTSDRRGALICGELAFLASTVGTPARGEPSEVLFSAPELSLACSALSCSILPRCGTGGKGRALDGALVRGASDPGALVRGVPVGGVLVCGVLVCGALVCRASALAGVGVPGDGLTWSGLAAATGMNVRAEQARMSVTARRRRRRGGEGC